MKLIFQIYYRKQRKVTITYNQICLIFCTRNSFSIFSPMEYIVGNVCVPYFIKWKLSMSNFLLKGISVNYISKNFNDLIRKMGNCNAEIKCQIETKDIFFICKIYINRNNNNTFQVHVAHLGALIFCYFFFFKYLG